MIALVEIQDLDDPLLLPWLDLYETAFPPGERILVSRILDALHRRARGEQADHLLAVLVEPDTAKSAGPLAVADASAPVPVLAGIVFYDEPEGTGVASLGYFAMEPKLRGQGIGAQAYRCLLERLNPRVRALIFDVEDPKEMTTPQAAALAERRIGFYRRQGARLLGGIAYLQTVGWHQPPLRLRLMVHPIQEVSPQEAFDLGLAIFGAEILKQVGELRWE